MAAENRLTNERAESPHRLSKQFLTVLKKHLAIFAEHYRQPISEISTIAYAEDLRGLTPTELDAACLRARQDSEFMPVSAAILKAHHALNNARAGEYLGLPQLAYPPITQEEREAALEFSEALRKKLLKLPPPDRIAPRKKLTVISSTRSLEEQKAELRRRGFLR